MKSVIVLSVIVSLSLHAASAQETVPNPYFHSYNTCPTTLSQLNYCNNWYSPNYDTPDYFNECDTLHYAGVPTNIMGYQVADSQGYAGGGTYFTTYDGCEYIASEITPLEQGATYNVTIKVSLSETSTCGNDGLAVFFYKYAKPDTNVVSGIIPVTPQIDYTSSGIITDKINWTTLSQNFMADSAYTHLVVGIFKHVGDIHIIRDASIPYVPGDPLYAYYYYGLVSVVKIFNASVNNFSDNINTSIYPNPFLEYSILKIENTDQSTNLVIFNAHGSIVRQIKNITTSEVKVMRDDLQPGLYYYRLQTADNMVGNGKFTVL